MPVDEGLNTRLRNALAAHVGISEKQMMGGQCFFLNGNMLCGARRHIDGVGRFMFRVGKANEASALLDPSANEVIHGSRKLGGFVRVDAADCDDTALQRWLQLCLAHAAALPAKD
ncbi:TfoX/Sxy family protein [Cognatiyoonia sp. IB215182]|uniref:TfoX/Sxy family protein n=1 Tax=Cognatiyoonia sp. IB215182 TaxID=3097353 RepID=UPI002A154C33|nr:TfoX/Sxy family protein [Cognatiyoonia sp. IB215182]MDX8351815.1 TfoX/Sxy family protein [Cognatiyoonia sp. IB215182]